MSQENVAAVRGFYDAFGRGDLESALAAFDPDAVAYDHDIPDSGQYQGLEGLLRWQADWESSWESWRWEPQEFIEEGDRVVAIGRGSGVNVERLDGAVWTLRGGKCVRLDSYGSKAEALEAVGLRE
jgi:uncharacterized protein